MDTGRFTLRLLCLLVVFSANASATPEVSRVHLKTPESRAQACRQVLEKAPNRFEAHRCFATAMARLNRQDELRNVLRTFRTSEPENARLWYFEGRVVAASDPRRAEAHFQECRNYGKPVRWCYFGEALALEEQGRHREALELVRLARSRLQAR